MKYKNWEIIKKPFIGNKGGGQQNNVGITRKYRWSAKKGEIRVTGGPSLRSLKDEIYLKED